MFLGLEKNRFFVMYTLLVSQRIINGTPWIQQYPVKNYLKCYLFYSCTKIVMRYMLTVFAFKPEKKIEKNYIRRKSSSLRSGFFSQISSLKRERPKRSKARRLKCHHICPIDTVFSMTHM